MGKFREELRTERRDELFNKLEKVRLEGVQGAGSGDIRSKIKGIKRTIEKGKPKTKATKALLKAAKQQGLIRNVKDARRIIEGKKKKLKPSQMVERKLVIKRFVCTVKNGCAKWA